MDATSGRDVCHLLISKRPKFLAKLVMGVHDQQTAKTLECGKEWPIGSTIDVRQISKGHLCTSSVPIANSIDSLIFTDTALAI
jgi:hypothetical protein